MTDPYQIPTTDRLQTMTSKQYIEWLKETYTGPNALRDLMERSDRDRRSYNELVKSYNEILNDKSKQRQFEIIELRHKNAKLERDIRNLEALIANQREESENKRLRIAQILNLRRAEIPPEL